MIGKLLCWLGLHRWRWNTLRCVSRRQEQYIWIPECKRCQYAPLGLPAARIIQRIEARKKS